MKLNWILGGVFIFTGLFSLIASIKEWEFFFNARKASWIENLIGRSGARIFYGILGIALIIVGLLSFTGTVDLASGF